MKTLTALALASIMVSVLIIASPTLADSEPAVGVIEGDWIEYNINLNGTGSLPPTHDVRWLRIEVLEVDGTAFSANFTARYANGTVGSAVWKFNFSEGNVGGWIIIPANLGVGDTFYDSAIHNHQPVNVTVQREEQKTVLGTSRIVTYGNDSLRHKEWDKTTGVMIGSLEAYENYTTKKGFYIGNLTVTEKVTATNMWSPEPQIEGVNPAVFYMLVAAGILLMTCPLVLMAIRRKKLSFYSPRQKTITCLLLLAGLVMTVGGIAVTPVTQNPIPMSFWMLNLLLQSLWTVLVLVSMLFRMRGNYSLHAILMIVVVCITLVSFTSVLFMSPPTGSSLDKYFSSPIVLIVTLFHSVISFPALIFGVWLVALWRPGSTTFAAKSKRIAQLVAVFWSLSYAAGVFSFLALHTTLFG